MSDRPDLRKTNTGEKIKRKDIVATRSWTREELEVCIEDCGGVADQETVDRLAEKLKAYLSDNDILQKLAGEIEMEPATEPAASLKKLGVSLPACDLCGHFYEGECGHYEEKVFRCNWDDARDCGHFYSDLPSRVLQYADTVDGELYSEEFALPVILDTGTAFPDAASVVTALRKDPGLSEMLDQVVWGVEDKEDPTKWELAEESPYVF